MVGDVPDSALKALLLRRRELNGSGSKVATAHPSAAELQGIVIKIKD